MFHYLGRVHAETGDVEYLGTPCATHGQSKKPGQRQVALGKRKSSLTILPIKVASPSGTKVTRERDGDTYLRPVRLASGRYLFLPVVTGTVYVIDTEVEQLSPKSLVAVNDLGPGGETWSLASLTYSGGRLFAHTMGEVVCVERVNE